MKPGSERESVMRHLLDRRDALTGLGALAAAGVWRPSAALANEPPPETTTLRLRRNYSICIAPQYIADALLRAEGFTDIRYVDTSTMPAIDRLDVLDFNFETAPFVTHKLDAGWPIVALSGLHVGCYELIVQPEISTIGELRGRRVMVPARDEGGHFLLMTMLAHVGLDPHRDVEWLSALEGGDPMEAFIAGEVDGLLGFPPQPQILRERGVGRVILSTARDRPWSGYFCCMLFGMRDFVSRNPIATKRYMRAVLKAADLCASSPEQAADALVAGGFTGRRDLALQTLEEIPYDRWRDYDPEDSIRFFALRLHDIGMIRNPPNRIIQTGTDWRLLDELKRELRA